MPRTFFEGKIKKCNNNKQKKLESRPEDALVKLVNTVETVETAETSRTAHTARTAHSAHTAHSACTARTSHSAHTAHSARTAHPARTCFTFQMNSTNSKIECWAPARYFSCLHIINVLFEPV